MICLLNEKRIYKKNILILKRLDSRKFNACDICYIKKYCGTFGSGKKLLLGNCKKNSFSNFDFPTFLLCKD